MNLYMACGFVPGGLFLLVGWPAWEVMYWTAWWEAPYNRPLVAGFYVLFVIVMILLGNLGFILGHHWYRKGKDKRVVYGSIIGGILTVLPFLLQWGVWMDVGTYAEVKAGTGYSFWQAPFFHGWLCIISYLGITLLIMGIWLKKRDNRFKAADTG